MPEDTKVKSEAEIEERQTGQWPKENGQTMMYEEKPLI